MAAKKPHLRLLKGGGGDKKDKQVLAVNRPLIGIVQASELDPKMGLRASDYLEDKPRKKPGDGRSRIYPEINVLNSAKGWYRSMIRLARSEGYTDMKKFFKESKVVNDHDKRLFNAVKAFIEFEQGLPRKREG